MKNGCTHNHRARYTHGFYCEDCDTFFDKKSPTYRSTELLSNIWMVLWNINADRVRARQRKIAEVTRLMNKVGIGVRHKDYESLIAEAERMMKKYGKNSESATRVLR